jgi:alkylation response protein AidB-like acyl-CoA dehydrogenase
MSSELNLGPSLGSMTSRDEIADFRERVRSFIDQEIIPLVGEVECSRHFPRQAITAPGSSGLLRERWSGGRHGDLGRSVLPAEEIGLAGLGGVGVSLSLHSEAPTATLRQSVRSDYARQILQMSLDGEIVCCVAPSEQLAGSGLSAISTELKRDGGRYLVRGTKWFAITHLRRRTQFGRPLHSHQALRLRMADSWITG